MDFLARVPIARSPHLFMIFPKRKGIMEKKNAGKPIYLPVPVVALIGVVNFSGHLPDAFPAALIIGLVLIGYSVLPMAALIHSFVTAERGRGPRKA